MARLRRVAAWALDGLVVQLFLFFVYLVREPHLWNGPLGIAWLVVLGLLCISFGAAIAIGIRRRRSTDAPMPNR
jgi:hypothetical protein